MSFRCTTGHCTAVHQITLNWIILNYIQHQYIHCVTSRYDSILVHSSPLQLFRLIYMHKSHSTALHCVAFALDHVTLRFIRVYYVAAHHIPALCTTLHYFTSVAHTQICVHTSTQYSILCNWHSNVSTVNLSRLWWQLGISTDGSSTIVTQEDHFLGQDSIRSTAFTLDTTPFILSDTWDDSWQEYNANSGRCKHYRLKLLNQWGKISWNFCILTRIFVTLSERKPFCTGTKTCKILGGSSG